MAAWSGDVWAVVGVKAGRGLNVMYAAAGYYEHAYKRLKYLGSGVSEAAFTTGCYRTRIVCNIVIL
jgi:hypothetical protein